MGTIDYANTPAEVNNVARQIGEFADTYGSRVTNIYDLIDQISSSWMGQASENYKNQAEAKKDAINVLVSNYHSFESGLGIASSSAEQANEDIYAINSKM